MITRVEAFDLRLPLKVPYHTAIADLREFTILMVVVEDDRGGWGVGDCTTVLGYSWEGPESAWEFACTHGPKLPGLSPAQAFDALSPLVDESPFASTAFLTAVEMIAGEPTLALPAGGIEVPLVGLADVKRPSDAPEVVAAALAQGFRTLKLKVGFDVEDDIARARATQETLGDRGLLRIDANQGYSFEDASRFVHGVDPANVELFEQPFEEGVWEPMVELAGFSPLPLMLDESIYREEHIDKTAALRCANVIKLKLMKAGSGARLARQIERVRGHGMKVVVGNGVASEVGCYHEALVMARVRLETAGENNAFLKPKDPLLTRPFAFRQGHLVAEPGFQLELDREKLVALSRERRVWEAKC